MPFVQQHIWSEPDGPITALDVAPLGKEDHRNLLRGPAWQHTATEPIKAQHSSNAHCYTAAAQPESSALNRDVLPRRLEEVGNGGGGSTRALGCVIPGVPVDADVDVAVQLQLPLLGPSPQLCKSPVHQGLDAGVSCCGAHIMSTVLPTTA